LKHGQVLGCVDGALRRSGYSSFDWLIRHAFGTDHLGIGDAQLAKCQRGAYIAHVEKDMFFPTMEQRSLGLRPDAPVHTSRTPLQCPSGPLLATPTSGRILSIASFRRKRIDLLHAGVYEEVRKMRLMPVMPHLRQRGQNQSHDRNPPTLEQFSGPSDDTECKTLDKLAEDHCQIACRTP
jgi:hypothetical protein